MAEALDDADAGGGDEDLVALAAIDYFGVAGDEQHAGFAGGGTHGIDDAAQVLGRESLFEDEGGGKVERTRAAHGQVVDRAVDGQTTDVAAGEEDRGHDERVGGEGQSRAVDFDDRLVIELVEQRIAKGRQEDAFDQLRRQFAAAAVAEHNLVAAHDRQWTRSAGQRGGFFSLRGVLGPGPAHAAPSVCAATASGCFSAVAARCRP